MCVIYHVVCAAGPLSQWQLIFYGTETPPQESDASPESNSLGSDPDVGITAWKPAGETVPTEQEQQNSINDDLALVWHDSHAVSLTLLFTRTYVVYSLPYCRQQFICEVGPYIYSLCYFVDYLLNNCIVFYLHKYMASTLL